MSAPQAPGPQPAELRCPRCGATVAPEQDWCLECGAPARTRLAQTPNWRLPVAAVAAIAVLAGAALAVAFAELTGDDGPVTTPATTQTAPTTQEPVVPPGIVGDPSATQTVVPPITETTPVIPTTPTIPPSTTPTDPGVPTIPPSTTPPVIPTVPTIP